MEKSRDAFRTISEVADWLGTPTHVLRFWESRFVQVKPVKRAGGRRYYRPADMELLGGIKKLLHDDGLTIRGVQKILREEGVKHVSALSPAVELPDDAKMAVDVELIAEQDNVVQLSPQAAEADLPVADVAEPALEVTEPEAPEVQASEPENTISPPDESPAGAPSETQIGADLLENDAPKPITADTESPVEPEPEPEPGPGPARRSGIFAAPPLSADPAPDAPLALPEDPSKADPAPSDPAPSDPAPSEPETPEPEVAKATGPDIEALRPIYDRLLALRERMGNDTPPPHG